MVPTGRPRTYPDPWELAEKVNEYLAECKADDRLPTLSGLSLWLGFADPQTFTDYAGHGDDFSLVVKATRTAMERERAEQLHRKDLSTPGLIFYLKARHGWRDGGEIDQAKDGPKVIERVIVRPTTSDDTSNTNG